tara:strand:- start:230 stop:2083 length:1854 start_codon:yes stop_codon:yes gene_type:complete
MAPKRQYVKDREDVKNLAIEVENLTKKQESFFSVLTTSGDKFEKVVKTAKTLAETLAKSNNFSEKANTLAENQAAAAKLGLSLGSKQTFLQKVKNRNALNELKISRKSQGVKDKITDKIIEQVEEQYEQVDLAKEFGKSMGRIDSVFGGIGATIKDGLTNPLVGAGALLATFNAQQETIAKQFGGIGVTQFRKELTSANQEFVQLGLTSEDAQSTISNLANSFGLGIDEASKLSETVGRIAASTGMSVDESTKLVGLFTQTQGLSGQQAEDLLLGARQLAVANNVAPDKVLSDIASNTEVFARFSQDGGENLLRAAVQARKLGISLDTVAKTADSLLNFQDSLNKEIEASILLGRDVNLQKARELSLNNDIEGLQQEILKQVGSEAEFNKMNRLQRDALADALNMEASDLQKIVSRQGEQLTLQGEINRLTSENEIPEDTITGVAQILADFKTIGMQLAESIGPSLNRVLGFVSSITGALSETKLLLPAIGILLGAMVTKSAVLFALQAGYTYAQGVAKFGPLGLPMLLAAPLVIGGLTGALMNVPRFQNLDDGDMASIVGGPGVFDSGETVVKTTSLENMMKPVVAALDRLILRQEDTTTAVRRIGGDTATALGDM